MEQYQGEKIGVAAEVSGDATVTRANGSTEILQKGTLIFEDDTIETSQHGAVNITFNDDTIFVVSQNASMVIDEYVYDANQDGEGDIDISVARGVFAYTSGFIGHEDPQDVNIETPVGSIGIRGTTFTASIPEENSGEEFKVSILEGAIAVKPRSGGEFLLDDPRESLEINVNTFEVTELGILTPDQVMDSFNVIQTVAPQLMAPVTSTPGAQNNFITTRKSVAPDNKTNNVNEANTAQDGDTPKPAPSEAGPEHNDLLLEGDGSVPNEDMAPQQEPVENLGEPNELDATMQPEGPIGEAELMNNLDPLQPTDPLQQMHGEPMMVNDILVTSDPILNGPLPPPPGTGPIPLGPGPNQPFNPSISGGSAVNNGPVNQPPTATGGTYIAFEQAGLELETSNFNISKFFQDPNGDALTYTVSSVTPGLLSAAPNIVNGNVFFTPNNSLGADATLSFSITASDGLGSATKNFQTTIFNEIPFGGTVTNDNDNISISANTYAFSTLGGDDNVAVISNNNVIFGGLGNDSVTFSGDNNKAYGESGADILKILSGNGNLISGGGGQDTLEIKGNSIGDFQAFGGDAADLIIFDANGFAAFQSSANSIIDGGRGADKMSFNDGGLINFSAVNDSAILSIEKIDISNGSVNNLRIDVMDVLTYNDHRSLFINVDGDDNMQLINTGTTGGNPITPTNTNVSNPFDSDDANNYTLYSFNTGSGVANLYVHIDGGGSGGSVTGI